MLFIMQNGQASPPPGWYENGAGQQQWWNGSDWGPLAPLASSVQAAPTKQSKKPGWGSTIGWLIAAGVTAFLVWGLPAMTKPSPETMMEECIHQVAGWAEVDPAEVEGTDVSDENIFGEAWDFRGTYPGGDWSCGGPADSSDPAQVMAYPDTGDAEQIK